MEIVDAGPHDLVFLEKMWHAAAFWRPGDAPSPNDAMRIPDVARYINAWGRAGDVALVARDDGRRLGAAWYRLFPADEPGYGFVAADVPELAIAVEADVRRRGVATALLEALFERARADGYRALSLSVNDDNPSRRVYQRLGFDDVERDEGGSWVMLRLIDG